MNAAGSVVPGGSMDFILRVLADGKAHSVQQIRKVEGCCHTDKSLRSAIRRAMLSGKVRATQGLLGTLYKLSDEALVAATTPKGKVAVEDAPSPEDAPNASTLAADAVARRMRQELATALGIDVDVPWPILIAQVGDGDVPAWTIDKMRAVVRKADDIAAEEQKLGEEEAQVREAADRLKQRREVLLNQRREVALQLSRGGR